MKLYHYLFHNNKDVKIVDENDNCYNCYDLRKNIDLIINKFQRKTLTLLQCENDIGTIICYLANLKKENAIMLIDSKISKENVIKLIQNYKPSNIILNNSAPEKELINLNEYFLETYKNKKIFRSKKKKKYKINQNLCLLISTSGTTGTSKFVALSNKNIQFNLNQIIYSLKIQKKDCTITTLPLNYSFGLSVFNSHFKKGSKIILNEKSILENIFWNRLENHKVSNLNFVPFQFRILDKIKWYSKKIHSLSNIACAGGALLNNELKKICDICTSNKINFHIMYGQTEASPRMSSININQNINKIGSIGKGLIKSSLSLVDENLNNIKVSNKIGEIVYEGENIFMGYCNDYNDLLNFKKRSKLFTGDLAYFDCDGYFFISGRKNRLIKLYGIRINLDELEKDIFNKIETKIFCYFIDDTLQIFLENDNKLQRLKEILKEIGFRNQDFNLYLFDQNNLLKSGKQNYEKLKRKSKAITP